MTAIEVDKKLGTDTASEVERTEISRTDKNLLDPVSLGSLIVGIASLAWTIGVDLRDRIKDKQSVQNKLTEKIVDELLELPKLDDAIKRELVRIVVEKAIEELFKQ
ncbi:MAG: hypothetical protein HY033_11435 [Ignavibacteriae bacterium]|nr:hypothetical protein [Ignavibacteriota bacterium]